MARDETARERDSDRQLLGRRTYLKSAGAAASAVAATAVAGQAGAAEYDTVTVPAGQTRRFSLGDGDTLENVLVDITAQGAEFRIHASGDGWAIRNVGIRGRINSTRAGTPFTVRTDGGTGVIENVHLGGGNPTDQGQNGLFVLKGHSGTIEIDRLNVQNWGGNGVYASAPGNGPEHSSPGAGGEVHITNSYAKDNDNSNFRIGTTGSYCENCVSVGGNRAFWGYYERTRYVNCDASGAGQQFCAGAYAWEKGRRAEMVLENCRARGTLNLGPGTLVGSPASGPRTSPPDGVPTTPEEAASGSSSGGSDSGSDDGQNDQQGSVLELVSASNASNATYEFTVAGSVQKRTDVSENAAEAGDSDSVTENDDGTVTVTGVSGNGYGDSYLVDGVVTDVSLDESQWTLFWDGNEVSAADVVLPNLLVVDGSDAPGRLSSYEFTVSGEVAKDPALGSIQADDVVGDGTITGQVVGGVDAYRFAGEITGFTLDGPATVRVEDDV